MSGSTNSTVVRHSSNSSSMLCQVHDGKVRCPAENKVTLCLRHKQNTLINNLFAEAVIRVSRHVKAIKIHQDFPKL